VIIAEVTGAPGAAIQSWRERYDPREAVRLPPHLTLCYRAPALDRAVLEEQVHHAFREPVSVALGRVRQFPSEQRTLYVEVTNADALDRARRRLYDGTHVQLPGAESWAWHVTCLRDLRGRDDDALVAAAGDLRVATDWRVELISFRELRGDTYEALARWHV